MSVVLISNDPATVETRPEVARQPGGPRSAAHLQTTFVSFDEKFPDVDEYDNHGYKTNPYNRDAKLVIRAQRTVALKLPPTGSLDPTEGLSCTTPAVSWIPQGGLTGQLLVAHRSGPSSVHFSRVTKGLHIGTTEQLEMAPSAPIYNHGLTDPSAFGTSCSSSTISGGLDTAISTQATEASMDIAAPGTPALRSCDGVTIANFGKRADLVGNFGGLCIAARHDEVPVNRPANGWSKFKPRHCGSAFGIETDTAPSMCSASKEESVDLPIYMWYAQGGYIPAHPGHEPGWVPRPLHGFHLAGIDRSMYDQAHELNNTFWRVFPVEKGWYSAWSPAAVVCKGDMHVVLTGGDGQLMYFKVPLGADGWPSETHLDANGSLSWLPMPSGAAIGGTDPGFEIKYAPTIVHIRASFYDHLVVFFHHGKGNEIYWTSSCLKDASRVQWTKAEPLGVKLPHQDGLGGVSATCEGTGYLRTKS